MPADLLAFLKWYLSAVLAGALALPWTFGFFKHLPDRGYAFAKTLGLLLIGYVFWLLASFGFLRNDVGGVLFAAAVVGGLGLAWLKRSGLVELRAWLEDQLPTVIGVEVVFLLAFALMTLVRAYNPEISATEKPMEFMFINSILRSPTFPPHDAWLSGHAISYYYFGYVLVAALARVTATPAAVAFNLGLALLFALAAAGALGVVMNLAALVKREWAKLDMEPNPPLIASFWPGLLGPLMLLVVGNFYGLLAVAHANGLFADLKVWAVRYDFGDMSRGGETPPSIRAGPVNVWEWLDIKGVSTRPEARSGQFNWDPGFWWWFNGARVVHDRTLTGVEVEAIDEMPAFSFVLGDLHPHVLALPFVILAIGLALDWLLWGAGANPDAPWPLDRLLVSAVILGGLAFLNTWDFPIYWFLLVTALALGLGLKWGWAALLQRLPAFGLFAVVLAIASVTLYLPFYFTFQSQAGGVLPNIMFPTRFEQTFVMFGPVLIGVTLFVAWLTARRRGEFDVRAGLAAGGVILAAILLLASALALAAFANPDIAHLVDIVIAPLTRPQAIQLMWQRRWVDSLAALFPLAIISLVAGLVVGALTRSAAAQATSWREGSGRGGVSLRSPALLMALLMILTGALLLLGPEFVYLRDNFGSRMNTVFKFYFQTWNLWALVTAFGIWYVFRFAGRVGRWIMAGVMTLAVVGGLIYTAMAVNSKTGGFAGPPTLDGMAYFAKSFPDDWAAIQWLQANAPDSAVVAEGIGGQYWQEGRFSRISMATGLQTVMGWPGHESQWRGQYFTQVADREKQIQTLYQTRDWQTAQAILDTYDIEYVVVSSLEREKYKDIQHGEQLYQPKFDRNMKVVFQSGDVTIYQRADHANRSQP